MSKKTFYLVPIFSCSVLLLTGAFNYQDIISSPAPPWPTQPSRSSFVPQPAPVAPGLEKLDGPGLLEKALAALAPNRVRWLRMKTWQKLADDELSFEAEGRLVLGPNHCARLEMTCRTGPKTGQYLVVADGVVLAQVLRLPGQSPQVSNQPLFDKETGAPAIPLDQLFRDKGCAGPYPLLCELQRKLTDLQVQTGHWQNRPALLLTGNLPPTGPAGNQFANQFAMPPRRGLLVLDPQTLWPLRLEWWGDHSLLLELEFRDPEINQQLAHADCVREFTYTPE